MPVCAVIAGGTEAEREHKRQKMLAAGCEVVMLASDMREAAHASVTLRELMPTATVDVVALDRPQARFSERCDFSTRIAGRARPDYEEPAKVEPEFLSSWDRWSRAPR